MDIRPTPRPVLDPSRLRELRGLYTAVELTELLDSIDREVTQEIVQLEHRLGDPELDLASAAHRLKNSATLVGATAFAAAAARLEDAARVEVESGGVRAAPDQAAVTSLCADWARARSAIREAARTIG